MRFALSATSIALMLLSLHPTEATASLVQSIDPRSTYFHTNGDPNAGNATAIDLTANGFLPGMRIRITRVGGYDNSGPQSVDDFRRTMSGVFSASNILGPPENVNRVVGAIDAGDDWTSPNTFVGGESTDIPEDFLISDEFGNMGTMSSVALDIPNGATHLFVSAVDTFFGDNADPNENFGVQLAIVPEPSSLAMLSIAGFSFCGMLLRQRLKTAEEQR